jgi:hypothetical protein
VVLWSAIVSIQQEALMTADDKKTVDGYIHGLSGWQAEVVAAIRKLVREAAPEAKESIKWAQPVYESNGPFCFIRAFKSHVNFGFWRGAEIPDPHGLLQGEGEKMKHVKLTSLQDLAPQAFQDLVRAAVRLNQTKGDPTKSATK